MSDNMATRIEYKRYNFKLRELDSIKNKKYTNKDKYNNEVALYKNFRN